MKALHTVFFLILVQAGFAQQSLTFKQSNNANEIFTYTGQVSDGKANGYGVATSNKNTSYKGYWKDNLFEGKGVFTYDDGSIYDGYWKNNKREGRGKFIWKDGRVFEGDWEYSNRVKGKEVLPNGNIYEGSYFADKWSGKGKYYWKEGGEFDGNWFEGQRSGKGKEIMANGNTYEGEYKNDAWHGPGKYTFKNGDILIGRWSKNKQDGVCSYTNIDGTKSRSYWENGIRKFSIDQASETFKTVTYPTGTYEGEIANGLENGNGRFYFNDGRVYSGEWKNGLPNGKGALKYLTTNAVDSGQFDFGKSTRIIPGSKAVKKVYAPCTKCGGDGKVTAYSVGASKTFENSYVRKAQGLQYHDERVTIKTTAPGAVSSYQASCDQCSGKGHYNYMIDQEYQIAERSEKISLVEDLLPNLLDKLKNKKSPLNKSIKGLQNLIFRNQFDSLFFYTGEMKNETATGFGIASTISGFKYTGNWQNNVPNGFGVGKWSNGNTYVGEWKDGVFDGQGEFFLSDKKEIYGNESYTYIGEWKDGFFHGLGTFTQYNYNSRPSIYTGNWINGKLNGAGSYNKQSNFRNEVYVGEYKDGKKHGTGTYLTETDRGRSENYFYEKGVFENDKFIDGKKGRISGNNFEEEYGYKKITNPFNINEKIAYKGELKNGKPDGYGSSFDFGSNEYYIGNFKDGMFHGRGQYIWRNGSNPGRYVGGWAENKKSGSGVYVWKDETIYIGEWLDGNRNGKGKMMWADGSIYEGDWKDDQRTGYGKYYFPDGTLYEGGFKNGFFEGKGKMYWESGERYEGDFINDKRSGKGTYTYANNDKHEGEWKDGKRTGYGKYTSANGKVDEGYFENGVLMS